MISSLKNLNINITHHIGIWYLHLKNLILKSFRSLDITVGLRRHEQMMNSVKVTSRHSHLMAAKHETIWLALWSHCLGTWVFLLPLSLLCQWDTVHFSVRSSPICGRVPHSGYTYALRGSRQPEWSRPLVSTEESMRPDTVHSDGPKEATQNVWEPGSMLTPLQFFKKQHHSILKYCY